MRADARRNREQLVAAAVELLAEEGVDAPLDAIARRAGVGIGTLYRHFPDRHALAEAVALEAFTTVRGLARDAAAPAAGQTGLRGFLTRIVELRIGVFMASLLPLLEDRPMSEELAVAFDGMVTAIEALVAHAHEAGQLREDASADDVMLLLAVLTQPLPGGPREYGAAVTPRLLHLAVEGLQPSEHATCPPPAPARPGWGA